MSTISPVHMFQHQHHCLKVILDGLSHVHKLHEIFTEVLEKTFFLSHGVLLLLDMLSGMITFLDFTTITTLS